ncbi:DUF3408 domain-containing protein [Myroides injenensis]|uniref:DUF3408 domain-containing protein n=1 Tax=Myroides injenensis TaxID=1183151 RepID=UPI0022720B65|nr:DUF3408 domain-containing protein [Myroides injenensis]
MRPEFHKKLNWIVQVIGKNKVSVYTYLHNLLEHHFNEFEQQITAYFNDENKLFFKIFY